MIKGAVLNQKHLKLHLGCGKDIKKGFVNCDIQDSPGVNFRIDCGDLSIFERESADLIFGHSFFEHLYLYQQEPFLKECLRVLGDCGLLVLLGIPDFKRIAWLYLTRAPGENPFGGTFNLYQVYRLTHGDFEENGRACIPQLHKTIFDKEALAKLLASCGFPHFQIFNYRFLREKYNSSIGIVASKKRPISKLGPDEVLQGFKEYIDDLNELTMYFP